MFKHLDGEIVREGSGFEMKNWIKEDNNSLKKVLLKFVEEKSSVEVLTKLMEMGPVRDGRVGKENNIAKMKSIDDLDGIIDVIYMIRCNLFHGRKDMMESRDAELIYLSMPILKGWMKKVKKDFLL